MTPVTEPKDQELREILPHVFHTRHRRGWEDAHLPILGSLLGLDLILLLTQLHIESRSFSLKEIYLSLPYSENAIRLHLQKLERQGWIAMDSPGGDRRFKAIRLCRKFEQAIAQYARVLLSDTDAPDMNNSEIPRPRRSGEERRPFASRTRES
jgi:hypothetical protein